MRAPECHHRQKRDGDWWDPAFSLKYDEAGVNPQQTRRLCERAARWAASEPLTEAMSEWFLQAEVLTRTTTEPDDTPNPA
ncbi:MAG: hypothetical protein R3E89_16945 [Thiolinea sp.]